VTAPSVVVIDAMVDLAATLSQVEDWLRWGTPRTDEGADRLDAGAAALTSALRRSRPSPRRPRWRTRGCRPGSTGDPPVSLPRRVPGDEGLDGGPGPQDVDLGARR